MDYANTILTQLAQANSGVLKVMIGAKNFYKDEKRQLVGFQFMAGAKNKANRIEIKLNGLDLYDVTFFKMWKGERKIKGEFNNVYFDRLKSLFEEETLLYLSF